MLMPMHSADVHGRRHPVALARFSSYSSSVDFLENCMVISWSDHLYLGAIILTLVLEAFT